MINLAVGVALFGAPELTVSKMLETFEFVRDLLPTCQGAVLSAQMVERPLVMVLSSLGITACTTFSGVLHFRRKDLK